MDKDDTYRRYILDAIAKIEKYVNGMTYQQFAADDLVQDGVVRELEIIGESAKRLSESFKANALKIPWKKVAGARDVLIHDYMSVDLEVVWKTVTDDLPSLKTALTNLKG